MLLVLELSLKINEYDPLQQTVMIRVYGIVPNVADFSSAYQKLL